MASEMTKPSSSKRPLLHEVRYCFKGAHCKYTCVPQLKTKAKKKLRPHAIMIEIRSFVNLSKTLGLPTWKMRRKNHTRLNLTKSSSSTNKIVAIYSTFDFYQQSRVLKPQVDIPFALGFSPVNSKVERLLGLQVV